MPARPPAQAAARLDRRAAPRRHLPVDHPDRTQLRHRTHQVPHLASLSPGWSPGWRIRGRRGVPGHDPLVALGLAVVAWRAGLGLLVAGSMADDAGEVVGAVAGAVVHVVPTSAQRRLCRPADYADPAVKGLPTGVSGREVSA